MCFSNGLPRNCSSAHIESRIDGNEDSLNNTVAPVNLHFMQELLAALLRWIIISLNYVFGCKRPLLVEDQGFAVPGGHRTRARQEMTQEFLGDGIASELSPGLSIRGVQAKSSEREVGSDAVPSDDHRAEWASGRGE